jgi:ferric-dicitrate binding protein FerR (iron transport regulator)
MVPNDRGMQLALGQVMYWKDKHEGNIRPNPKAQVLLDALQKGEGSWEASFAYLEGALDAVKGTAREQPYRDALSMLSGAHHEELEQHVFPELLMSEVHDRMIEADLREGFRLVEEGDYVGAQEKFASASTLAPHDGRLRSLVYYAEGLHARQHTRVLQWADQQRAEVERLKADAAARETQARRALERSQDALRLSQQAGDSQAAGIAQRAIAIAEQALAKVRALIGRLEARLASLEHTSREAAKGGAGRSSSVTGTVHRVTPQGRTSLAPGTPLKTGDEIQTGPVGCAELVLTDGSTIQLGPGSTLSLIRLGQATSLYEMGKGRLHAEMQCLMTSRRTCKAIRLGAGIAIAVRGTEFEIRAGTDRVMVTVLAGAVEIGSPAPGQPLVLAAGERAEVVGGEIRRLPPVKPAGLGRWWEE